MLGTGAELYFCWCCVTLKAEQTKNDTHTHTQAMALQYDFGWHDYAASSTCQE